MDHKGPETPSGQPTRRETMQQLLALLAESEQDLCLKQPDDAIALRKYILDQHKLDPKNQYYQQLVQQYVHCDTNLLRETTTASFVCKSLHGLLRAVMPVWHVHSVQAVHNTGSPNLPTPTPHPHGFSQNVAQTTPTHVFHADGMHSYVLPNPTSRGFPGFP